MRSRITQLAALEGEINDKLSGHFVEVNGAALYYEDHGDDASLILIDGRAPLRFSMGAGCSRARRSAVTLATRRVLRCEPRQPGEPEHHQGGAHISLSSYRVRTSIAVSDMARAAEFYGGKLGLSAGEDQSDESRIYACGGDTSLHVYASPAHAGNATATLATWYVADIERVVDELSSRGVTFERYDDPALTSDEKGIHELGDGRVAWFKDPDGNTFAVEQARSREHHLSR